MPDHRTRTEDDPEAAERAQRLLARFAHGDPTRGTTPDPGGDAGTQLVPPLPLPGPVHPISGDARYQVGALLGRGGGGEVWNLSDTGLDRVVAIKVQHPGQQDDATRSRRFASEAATTASLEHPGILPIYDLGRTADGRLWFTMRRASGRSLAEAMAEDPPPEGLRTLAQRVQVLAQACEAVAYAHHRGVIHRDLKPANIMLGDFGEVLVVDWGSAVRRDASPPGAAGTPLYMSPEQARGEPASERSDVFSLGATLWQLMTRRPPLDGDSDPAHFWERKRQGDLDQPDAAVLAHLPDDLVALTRSCLAADPARRPTDAAALRDALRAWQAGREAAALRARAEVRLAALRQEGDHAGFAQVADDLRAALRLAPGDARCTRLAADVRAAHARFALAAGELRLAAELADPADATFAADLAQARRAHARRRLALHAAALIALLALGAAGWLLWRDHRASFGVWQTVLDLDWAADPPPTSPFRSSLTNPTAQEPRRIAGAGLLLPALQAHWIDGVDAGGDVRITLDVRWETSCDGLEVVVAADRSAAFQQSRLPPSISGQFGSFQGTQCFASITRHEGRSQVVANAWVETQTGRDHHLVLTRRDNQLELAQDGAVVLQHPLRLAPTGPANRALALRAYAPVILRRLRIERLGSAERNSPALVGQALLAHGLARQAMDAFVQAADDHAGTAVAAECLARAIEAAAETSEAVSLGQPLFDRLATAHPTSPLLADSEASLALAAWQRGDLAGGLHRAAALLERHPDNRVALSLLNARPSQLPRPILDDLLRLVARTRDVRELDLSGTDIDDLTPIAGLPLRSLRLNRTRVRDLRPLAGMPLIDLAIEDLGLDDITPLAGMPLSLLTLSHNRVHDIGVLRGKELRRLFLNNNPVADLSPLDGLAPVMLDVGNTTATRLPRLHTHRLTSLNCSGTAIDDLGALAGAAMLDTLAIGRTPVADLAPLAGLGQLTRLDANDTPVADLSPIAGLPLTILFASNTRVADLSPLAGMPLLDLTCDGAPVHDITSLSGLPLRRLRLTGSQITDLTPLAGRALHEVTLGNDPMGDLTALDRVQCVNLGTTDLDPAPLLRHPSLMRLSGLPRAAARPAWLAAADQAKASGRSGLARSLRLSALLADADRTGLLALAERQGAVVRLNTNLSVGLEQGRQLAASVGARRAIPRDEADENALVGLPATWNVCWLGVATDADGGITWDGDRVGTAYRMQRNYDPQRTRGWVRVRSAANSWMPISVPTSTATLILEWDAP